MSALEAEQRGGAAQGSASLVYAYGLVAEDVVLPPDLVGLENGPVTTLRMEGVTAVVGLVTAGRFGVDEWQQHAEDVEWLRGVVEAHHTVLARLVPDLDVLPLRIPAIYADQERLAAVLGSKRSQIEQALERIQGRVEWGGKVFVGGPADQTEQPDRPQRGRDYLARRSAEMSARHLRSQEQQAAVQACHERLGAYAVESVSNRPQTRAVSGRREAMLLNAAYLVDRARVDEFILAAEQVAQTSMQPVGLELEVTGPWPAYNFTVAPR